MTRPTLLAKHYLETVASPVYETMNVPLNTFIGRAQGMVAVEAAACLPKSGSAVCAPRSYEGFGKTVVSVPGSREMATGPLVAESRDMQLVLSILLPLYIPVEVAAVEKDSATRWLTL